MYFLEKLIYFCRYSPDKKFGVPVMETSLAAVRRVEGFIEAFKFAKFIPYVFITPGIPTQGWFRPTEFRRSKGCIKIIPASVNLKNNYLSYVFNIVISAWISRNIQRRKQFSAVVMYNCMPDTILPGIFGSAFALGAPRVIELEEEISADNEAPLIFRIFEACARKLFYFSGAIVSSSTLEASVNSAQSLVINGIVTAQDVDESKKLNDLNSYRESIAFIGRLDEMRCISEFMTAVELLSEADIILEVNVVGYATSNELLKNIKKKLSCLENKIKVNFYQSVPRDTVVRVIKQSTVCVSLVREERFLEKSFPSKLIELLLFDKAIVSQRVNDLQSLNNFIWIDNVEPRTIYKAACSALQQAKKISENPYNGRDWVLAQCSLDQVALKIGNHIRSLK